MTMADLTGVRRLWLGAEDEIDATRLFRRTFEIDDATRVTEATVSLFADANYHLWVNGAYLGRGPTFFHPHRRPVDAYEIGARLKSGRNVVAVLAHSPGIALHNYLPAGTPGLVARVDVAFESGEPITITTDNRWKASLQHGWLGDTPRRSWAIGFVECFDANTHPDGWQTPEFDDAAWSEASERPPFPFGLSGTYLDTGLPRLRFVWQPVVKQLGRHGADAEAHTLNREHGTSEFAAALMAEPWQTEYSFRVSGITDAPRGGFTVERLNESEGAALCFDLGKEYIGGVCFQMRSDSDGLIDVGWAELVEGERPQLMRKGNSYADRYLARAGSNLWFPIGFSAGRYLTLVLRGFSGTVQFTRLGMLASEPKLDWSGAFECSNTRLGEVFSLCARTVRVGTQESLMDCPTREQASYVGDGNPNARWISRLTGDFSFWRRLILETFAVQREDGQIKTVTFSGERIILIDYSLLAVVGVRDYVLETGDVETARSVLEGCRRVLSWYEARRNADGLFDLPWETMPREAPWVAAPASPLDALEDAGLNLFIDHPGLGWHNRNDPGIDRRGLNAAINALLVQTLRALADLEEWCGADGQESLRSEADAVSQRAAAVFWNQAETAFADGIFEGALLPRISQQTNTWCLGANFCDREQGRAVLRRILRVDDAALARSGPYFWYYMLPALVEHGMVAEAAAAVETLWGDMLDQDATTAWETFAGDELDSYCHPWSAVPADFLPRSVGGIGSLPAGRSEIDLRPQIELLEWVRAHAFTAQGPVTVAWKWDNAECRLSGSLPPGVTGRLHLPGAAPVEVEGDWTFAASETNGIERSTR